MHWTIGRKLSAGFAGIILTLAALGALAVITMRSSAKAMTGIAREYLPEMKLASAFESEILNARIFFIYHVTIQKPGALSAGWEHFEKARALMPNLTAQAAGSPELEKLRQPTADLAADFATYERSLREILETVKSHRNKGPAFDAMIKEWARLGGKMVNAAAELRGSAAESAGASANDHRDQLERGVLQNIIGCLLAGFGGILGSWLLTRSIGRTLSQSAGSLDRTAQQLAASSEELSAASNSQAQSSSEQAATIEETSASFEEVGSMARRCSDSAQSMASTVAQSQKASARGTEELERMMAAMNQVSAANRKMSKIIKVIDEIAFQTNILALNAAVEAARAGEAGMGFAVVAGEVRNLALRAASAAKDTSDLIGESVEKTGAGLGYVESVAETMRSIAADADRAKALADELSSASAQQTLGIEQIGKALSQLEGLTQHVAAGAEQTASAATELASQASSMNAVACDLVAMVGAERR
jgi:ABC-type transporter Mla subunit MlaD